MAEDTLSLGGSIKLTGFSEIDSADMIVVKKIVGNYVKKMSEMTAFQELQLTLKKVHAKEGDPIFEIHGKVLGKKKVYTSEIDDRNLYVGLDLVLKKLSSEMGIK
ncbi:MAG: hypothetical protein GXP63_05085 [DPANN group archaeon]|nr:hypothetical protein [DPANN group archaeon]